MPIALNQIGLLVNLYSKNLAGPGLKDAKKDLDNLEAGIRKNISAARSFISAGLQMQAFAVAIGSLVVFPVKAAADFEEEMVKVRLVTRASKEDFTALTETARELGQTTLYSAVEAAQGMTALGKAGVAATDVIAAMPDVLALARIGMEEISDTAKISVSILRAFTLPTEDLSHVMDILSSIFIKTNMTLHELSESMQFVALEAKSAGINIETLGAMMIALNRGGLSSSKMGITLRGVISSLSKTTPRAKEAFEDLAVQMVRNAEGNIDFVSTLERLTDANMDTAHAIDIFRRTAYGGAAAIGTNAEFIHKLVTEHKNLDGQAQDTADALRVFNTSVTELMNALNGLKIALGTPLLDGFKGVVDGAASVTRGITAITDAVPGLTKALGSIASVAAGTIFALGSITLAVGLLAKAFLTWNLVLVKLTGVGILLNLSKLVLGLVPMFEAAAAAVAGLASAFMGLPLVGQALVVFFTHLALHALPKAINAFVDWREAVNDSLDAADKLKTKLKGLSKYQNVDTLLTEDINKMGAAAVKAYAKEVEGAIQQVTTLTQLKVLSNDTTLEERGRLEELLDVYKVVIAHMHSFDPPPLSAAAMASYVKFGKDLGDLRDEFSKLRESYKEATEEAKNSADEIKEWDQEMLWDKTDMYQKLAVLNQQYLVTNKETLAEEEVAKMQTSSFLKAIDEGNFKSAISLAKLAKDAYANALASGSSALNAMKRQFSDLESAAKQAYDTAANEAKKYAEKAMEWGDKLKESRLQGEELLHDLERRGQSEIDQWYDKKLEAENNVLKINELIKEGSEQSLLDAEKIAARTIQLYSELAKEVKEDMQGDPKQKTLLEKHLEGFNKIEGIFSDAQEDVEMFLDTSTKAAMEGIKTVMESQETIYTSLATLEKNTQSQFETDARKAAALLDEIAKDRESKIRLNLINLDEVTQTLTELESKVISVSMELDLAPDFDVTGKIPMKARGGKLPGDSKEDSLLVAARPGEWFIQNEAAKFWNSIVGSDFMQGINNPFSQMGTKIQAALGAFKNNTLTKNIPRLQSFATGGVVMDTTQLANTLNKLNVMSSYPAGIQNLGRIELGLGGRVYPVLGDRNTLSQLKNALEKETLMRSN